MRLHRFYLTGAFLTVFAFFYVHQHVEIIKSGYELQKSRGYHSCLVEQNSKLMYNLSRMESPRSLLASLDSETIEFSGLRRAPREAVRLAQRDVSPSSSKGGLFLRFFDRFTESAEAKTLPDRK